MQRKGLGKGLADLISSDDLKKGATLLQLRPHEIDPNPLQPRTAINEDELEDLTHSIERHGIVQPLVVRPSGSGYQLITGERRWRAAQRAGLDVIPCLVRETDDSEALQLALVENLQREDLNPIDAARGYRQLSQEFGLTQEQIAGIVGKSRAAIANTLRLLDLPKSIWAEVEHGRLSEGHARALLGLGAVADEVLEQTAAKVIEGDLTVRETEELVRQESSPQQAAGVERHRERPATIRMDDPERTEIEERIQRAIGTKVRLRPRKRGGTIQIWYHNIEDLERLIRVFDPPISRYGEFG